jgi:hypothetical protein
MRWHPRGYGGQRVRRAYAAASAATVPPHPEQVKREGWQEQGLLAISADDPRLTWPERELVRQLGEKLYGPRMAEREVANG